MLVTNKTDQGFIQNLPFKIATDSLKYLEVSIPKNAKDIYKLNYLAMLESLKLNIESWRTFPQSMVGSVNAIKMVTLPRFLYLFQNLPIFLPQFFFRTLDSIILPFVWGFKAHRISKLHVCKPRSQGGLGLPNFQHYYCAANCRASLYWKKISSYGACWWHSILALHRTECYKLLSRLPAFCGTCTTHKSGQHKLYT